MATIVVALVIVVRLADEAPRPSSADSSRVAVARPVGSQEATPPALETPGDDRSPVEPVKVEPVTELERWVGELRHGASPDERIAAAETLTRWVPGEAEAPLIEAIRGDPDATVREAAVEALADSESLVVVGAYVDALHDPDEWVREAGATGLYRLTDTRTAVGALAELCASSDRELRIRAAELIDEMVPDHLPWDEIWDGPVTFAWAPPSPFGEPR